MNNNQFTLDESPDSQLESSLSTIGALLCTAITNINFKLKIPARPYRQESYANVGVRISDILVVVIISFTNVLPTLSFSFSFIFDEQSRE